MIDAKAVDEQLMLRVNHVVVIVFRKLHVHPVTWLARLAVADSVRKDDVELRGIEELSVREQRRHGSDKASSAAGRAMQHQHCIPDDAARILSWRAKCCVMNAQRWKSLSALELEVADREVALDS